MLLTASAYLLRPFYYDGYHRLASSRQLEPRAAISRFTSSARGQGSEVVTDCTLQDAAHRRSVAARTFQVQISRRQTAELDTP